MVIWLRSDRNLPNPAEVQAGVNGVKHIGVHGDVVPRAAFGALMSLEAGYAQLAADREAMLGQAQAEAQAIMEAAQHEAAAILADARAQYDEAAQRGYRDGEARALADWMARQADAGDDQRRTQLKMRERLAEIVTVAVEQIVHVQQSEQLFERALATVDRIVEGATYLRVAVSPGDYDKACVAFERLSSRWRELGRPFPLSVVADKRLAPGSCICESDFGAVDASLATQLRAMRSAVSRALKHSAGEIDGLAWQQASDEPGNADRGEQAAPDFEDRALHESDPDPDPDPQ
ncbi:type III secretion protein L [Paraburkholderia kururiensis]|uniref:type III secretion system stator protein SctL n=1 Tax=Paraburkholderia kururiensis TaxID=984307 RepID=UPI0039A63699